jgi:putative acetyltransferase
LYAAGCGLDHIRRALAPAQEKPLALTITGAAAAGIWVREYRPADLDALIALFRESVRKIARRDYTQSQVLAWAPDDIDRTSWALRRSSRPTWVAEIEGALAGFTDLTADGLLDMLYVHPAYQGRGVARALIERAESAARASGLARLRTAASITARPVFERMGFQVVEAQRVILRGEALMNYRMEKLLR